MTKITLVGLDVGEKRIGVAVADTAVRIAIPYETLDVDGTEVREIAEIVTREDASLIVVGYPRNQQGEPTAQTRYAQNFAEKLQDIASVVFQDESLTSVLAEERLSKRGKGFAKGDVDKEAATIILQDYIESQYA